MRQTLRSARYNSLTPAATKHNTGVDTVLPLGNGSYELILGIGAKGDTSATPPDQVSLSGLGLSTIAVNGDSAMG